MTPGKLIKDAAIVSLISVAVLLFAEGVLRIIYPEKVVTASLTDSIAYQFDKDYLVSLKPNVEKEYTRAEINGGYTVHWSTNSDGFRGPELAKDPKYRIMVYGDSNIQARFSGLVKTFPAQLASFLQSGGKDEVEVINAGVLGFGPDQSLLKMKREADKYQPDLVIFHVFADNDFGDIIRNRLFELDSQGQLVTSNHPREVDPHLEKSERQHRKSFVSNLLAIRAVKKILKIGGDNPGVQESRAARVTRESPVSAESRDLEIQSQTLLEFNLYKYGQPKKISHFDDHYDIDIAINPDSEQSRIKRQLMNEVLKEARDFSRERGIEFMVLIQPSVIDMTESNATLSHRFLRKYADYKRTNLSAAVEEICVTNGIRYINLFDVYEQNTPGELYFKGIDDHWNDAGQRIAANAVAKYILETELLRKQNIGRTLN